MKMLVLLLGMLMAVVAQAEGKYPLQVELPQPGYKRTDGSLVSFTEFKKTTIVYGTCHKDPDVGIDEELGRVDVRSWGFNSGVFYVPVNTHICVVAAVIGLDDVPLGKSAVAMIYTGVLSTDKLPRTPRQLSIK